jgi:hypothetical protein
MRQHAHHDLSRGLHHLRRDTQQVVLTGAELQTQQLALVVTVLGPGSGTFFGQSARPGKDAQAEEKVSGTGVNWLQI